MSAYPGSVVLRGEGPSDREVGDEGIAAHFPGRHFRLLFPFTPHRLPRYLPACLPNCQSTCLLIGIFSHDIDGSTFDTTNME